MNPPVPILFVSVPSEQADQTESLLQSLGLSVTRADNICVAEIYADAERYEAAVYDRSLTPEEQVSLARVMRIRWPWMRIIRFTGANAPPVEHDPFDCHARSASDLATCIQHSFPG